MKGRAWWLAALFAGSLWGGSAGADTAPGVWDYARDPAERDRWALHLRVEWLLHPPVSEEELLPPELHRDSELRLEAARARLEQGGAETSPDVRLRFDLGVVYERLATLEGRRDLYQRAIDVLVPALAATPDPPGATEALGALVVAYEWLDRPRDELVTWRRLLACLDEDRERALPMMNMGEAEMRLGRLDDAVATFRRVLEISGGLTNGSERNTVYVLTLWDLAVALDRTGDPRGALDQADRARQLRWAEATIFGPAREVTGWDAINDHENVFFVPAWEREWYLALGTTAAARAEHEPRAAAELWKAAEGHWTTYVERASASPGNDRYLDIARVRRDRAHADRVAAEARAARAPRPPPAAPPNAHEQTL